MSDIVEFVLARIAEDETVARGELLANHSAERLLADCEAKRRIVRLCAELLKAFNHEPGALWDDVHRRERHHARVFLEALASIDADHPDFDEAWRA